jgi:hypothetical protein
MLSGCILPFFNVSIKANLLLIWYLNFEDRCKRFPSEKSCNLVAASQAGTCDWRMGGKLLSGGCFGCVASLVKFFAIRILFGFRFRQDVQHVEVRKDLARGARFLAVNASDRLREKTFASEEELMAVPSLVEP